MRHRTPTRWAPGPSVCSLTVTSSDPGDGSVRSSTCHKSVAPSRLAAVKRVWHDCSLTCTTSELERRNMHGGPGSPCIFQRVWPVELTDDLGPCQTLSSAHGSGSTLMASVWGTLSTPYERHSWQSTRTEPRPIITRSDTFRQNRRDCWVVTKCVGALL